MGNRRKRAGKKESEGPLAGHFKVGRKYVPPLLSYEQMVPSEWVRDDLPDLLWPLLLAVVEGDECGALIGRAQEAVLEEIPSASMDQSRAGLDGRLTSLERFPDEERSRLVEKFRKLPLRSRFFPPELLGVLSLYEDLPGRWLLVDPWTEGVEVPTRDDSINFLAEAVVMAIADAGLNAMIKTPPLGWQLRRGKLSIPKETGEILIGYPSDKEKRPLADATIRSSFLASKGADAYTNPEWVEERLAWTRSFWEQNRSKSPCVVEDSVLPSEREPQAEEQEAEPTPVVDVEKHIGRAQELYKEFVEFAFSTPVAYRHFSRHEVLCGLVSRSYRSLEALLRAPHLWTGEHASPVSRLMIETHILVTWMLQQHDDDVFEQYQSYGRGKRKLMRRQVLDLLEKTGGQAPEILRSLAESLERETGGEWGEQFQEVSVDSTFAGISVRQMAEEADLLDEYRHVYQPASGVTHGEWWAVEDYAMQRCMNPLHLFHQVPSMDEFSVEAEFPNVVLNYFERIIESAAGGLRTLADGADGDE